MESTGKAVCLPKDSSWRRSTVELEVRRDPGLPGKASIEKFQSWAGHARDAAVRAPTPALLYCVEPDVRVVVSIVAFSRGVERHRQREIHVRLLGLIEGHEQHSDGGFESPRMRETKVVEYVEEAGVTVSRTPEQT